jgi:hypothetical protein
MKKLFLGILLLGPAIHGLSQSGSNYKGNEKDCPYLHPENAKQDTSESVTLLLDDFENNEITYKQWTNGYESGNVKSDISVVNDSTINSNVGRISFTGEKNETSWTNLYCKAIFDKEQSVITFMARAPKEVKVQLTISQGKKHDEMEMYGHTFTIGTEWKLYHIKIVEINEFIFSHLLMANKPSPAKVINSKVIGLGFTEVDFPTVFYIDQLQIH